MTSSECCTTAQCCEHEIVPAAFVSLTYRLGSSLRNNKKFDKTISSKLMEVAELGDALMLLVDQETSQ